MCFGVEEEDEDDDSPEDSFDTIKTLLKEILDLGEGEARDIEFDRAHRMGRKRDTAVRPIVVCTNKGICEEERSKNQETLCQSSVAQRNHGQTHAVILSF